MGGNNCISLLYEVVKYADLIVVVDDCCPLKTGKKILEENINPKINVIFNKENIGVGGSTKRGFKNLIEKNCTVIVKIDADFQMNPADIPRMVKPIINNEYEATKGNRFTNIDKLLNMPKIRLIGNTFLSYLTKFSTGYWELFDPTNGFIAFRKEILENIDLNKTDNKFFFETDLLFRCSLKNVSIKNVEIDASYENSYSSLNPLKELPRFFVKNLKLLFKRIIYQYFILDFNPGSIELFLSLVTGFFGSMVGLNSLYLTTKTNEFTSAGTSSLFTVLSLISLQLFLAFIYYDCSTKVFFRGRK